MISLGVDSPDGDAGQLGPCARTEATIRMAIGQLENPTERLEHRLFWHLPVAADIADEFSDVKARHEACIAHLITASTVEEAPRIELAQEAVADTGTGPEIAPSLEPEPLSGPAKLAEALAGWRNLVAEDRFWDLMQTIELGGDFEPAAYPSEVDALRKTAVRMAAEPFVEGMRDALLQGNTETLAPWLSALSELSEEAWAADLAEEAGQQLLRALETRCTEITDQLAANLVRENGYVKGNTAVAGAGLNRYRTEAGPELARLSPLIAGVPALDVRAREATANCLAQVAGAFTWCDDFERAEKLFSEALSLSRGTMAELSLERGMEGIAQSAGARRRWGKKVDGAPSLFTLNGCGFSIYGSDDYDAESSTSVATYYFVLVFIPIFPIARYRIRRVQGNRYQFFGKLPLRAFDKWHLGIAAAVVAGLIMAAFIGGRSASSDSFVASGSSQASSSYTASELAEQAAFDASVAAKLPPLPENLSTYELKSRIDAGRLKIDALEAQVKPMIDQVSVLDNEMKPLQDELEVLKATKASGSKIDEVHYRKQADIFNADMTRRQALVVQINPLADQYDLLVADDKRMVAAYNVQVQ